MSMTKQNYRAIAQTLSAQLEDAKTEIEQKTVAKTAYNLATYFKEDNLRFRYDTFFEAVGLNAYGDLEEGVGVWAKRESNTGSV